MTNLGKHKDLAALKESDAARSKADGKQLRNLQYDVEQNAIRLQRIIGNDGFTSFLLQGTGHGNGVVPQTFHSEDGPNERVSNNESGTAAPMRQSGAVSLKTSRGEKATPHFKDDDVTSKLSKRLGVKGQQIDNETLGVMEQRFGADFGDVRVHTSASEAETAVEMGARAYTSGDDVVFAPGQYSPNSEKGHLLIAHELAHVLQHRRRPPGPASSATSQPGDAWERAAHAELGGRKQGMPAGPAPRFLLQTDPRHARGHAGEQQMGAGSYRAENGWLFVQGPSGAGGHGVTTSGADGVAYNVRTGELHILDNKSLARRGNVGSATAIDPQRNLSQNIDRIISQVEGMSQDQLPNRQRILRRLRQVRAAIRGGRSVRSVPGVRLIVTNAGGQSRGVTARLARLGVEFINIQQPTPRTGTPEAARALRAGHPEAPRPGRAKPPLGRGPQGGAAGPGQAPSTQQQVGGQPSQPSSATGAQGRVTSRGRRTTFQTPGRPTYPQEAKPSSSIRGTTRTRPRYRGAGMGKFMRPGAGAAAAAAPAAAVAWRDRTIRHAVATRILAKWSEVEKIRRDNPAHVILVEVSLQESAIAVEGMAHRGVNYVLVGHGPDRQTARDSIRGHTNRPPRDWVEVGPFEGWIEATDSLEEAKEYVESEEICFIATACYGTSMAEEVCLLRDFRDQALCKSDIGRTFIKYYYRHSPPIAQFIARHPFIKYIMRQLVLAPIVSITRLSEWMWRSTHRTNGNGGD